MQQAEYAAASDFSSLSVRSDVWHANLRVGAVLLTTFSIGFMEACLYLDRRPIPLRFAVKYAAVNVIPSAVWTTIPAHMVATASSVPVASLVTPATSLTDTKTRATAKRIMLLRTVQSLRYVVGSYGLGWSMWQLYQASNLLPRKERVLRVAPTGSALSRASNAKHGNHVTTVAVSQRNPSAKRAPLNVDLSSIQLYTRQNPQEDSTSISISDKMFLMEVELEEESTELTQVHDIIKTAASALACPTYTVAILPPSTSTVPSKADAFDIYVNPMSAVLAFVSSVCEQHDVNHVYFYTDDDDDDIGQRKSYFSELRNGLLYQYGIKATPLTEASETVGEACIVVFATTTEAIGRNAASQFIEKGVITSQNICFIVSESLEGQSTRSNLLSLKGQIKRPQRLSVTDLCDQTLQEIREMLRDNRTPSDIQSEIYRKYGVQQTLSNRSDQFSDIDKYI